MKTFLSIFLLLATNSLLGQNKLELGEGQQQVSYCILANNKLRTILDNFITKEVASNSDFTKKGFVVLNLFLGLDGTSAASKPLFKAHINKNYFSFDDLNNDRIFPDYYTFVNARPVLIYIRNLDKIIQRKYSLSSKKKFQTMIEPFIADPVKLSLPGAKGNTVFRPDEKIQLHGGIEVVCFEDESIEPIIQVAPY